MADGQRGTAWGLAKTTALLMLSGLVLAAWPGRAAAEAPEGAVTMRVLERTAEPLLVSEALWEEFTLGYCAMVMKDEDGWRMWYGAYDANYVYDCDSYLCLATSKDGVTWERPPLGRSSS